MDIANPSLLLNVSLKLVLQEDFLDQKLRRQAVEHEPCRAGFQKVQLQQ